MLIIPPRIMMAKGGGSGRRSDEELDEESAAFVAFMCGGLTLPLWCGLATWILILLFGKEWPALSFLLFLVIALGGVLLTIAGLYRLFRPKTPDPC